MPLMNCPACGREVSTAAPACPQCAQPIAGVVTPPPSPAPHRVALAEQLKIAAPDRADADSTMRWLKGLVVFALVAMIAAWIFDLRPDSERSAAGQLRSGTSDAQQRANALRAIQDALAPTGVEYVDWQGTTLLIVGPRMLGDGQVMADAACNALRGQGVRGFARVAVLERNAFLNGRREYMGEATCSLPR